MVRRVFAVCRDVMHAYARSKRASFPADLPLLADVLLLSLLSDVPFAHPPNQPTNPLSKRPNNPTGLNPLSTAHLELGHGDRIDVGDGGGQGRDVAELGQELDGAHGSGGVAAQHAGLLAENSHVCEGGQGFQRRLDLRLARETHK